MPGLNLNQTQCRQLLVDWFVRLGNEAGLPLGQRSASSDRYTAGNPNGFHIIAEFTDDAPYLKFRSSDQAQQPLIDSLAQQATEKVEKGDLGGLAWYSTTFIEVPFSIQPHSMLSPLLLRLGNQVRIVGWRRLGSHILLEFNEDDSADENTERPLLAPKATVTVHLAIPGPCNGVFSDAIVFPIAELVKAICTLALGRPVQLQPHIFGSKAQEIPELEARRQNRSIHDLARKGVSLDIFNRLLFLGGAESFQRARAALLTFDAAVTQERDSVACILYVVAAEALTTPFEPWRKDKLTKRFIEFFDQLMPNDLDTIVQHGNFEEAFGIKRGTRTARALRRELLDQIYAYRSGIVHEGLKPSYGGLLGSHVDHNSTRRGLLSDFAEMAIVRFVESPYSSIVGHPAHDRGTDT